MSKRRLKRKIIFTMIFAMLSIFQMTSVTAEASDWKTAYANIIKGYDGVENHFSSGCFNYVKNYFRLLDCVWERCGIDICENGILHFYGSGGAAYHYDKYYKMADDGYSVEMIDSFYIDSEENVVTLIDGSVIPFQGNYDTFGNRYSSADLNWLRLSPENAESVTGYSWDMISDVTNDEILLAPCYE